MHTGIVIGRIGVNCEGQLDRANDVGVGDERRAVRSTQLVVVLVLSYESECASNALEQMQFTNQSRTTTI